MRNRFPGTRYRCNTWCPAGEGHFEKIGSHFRVQHATCAIEWRGTPDPVRVERQQRRDQYLATQTGRAAQRARKRLRDQATPIDGKDGEAVS